MIRRNTEISTGTSAEDDDPGGGWGSRPQRRTMRSTVLMSSTCFLFLLLKHNESLLEILILMFVLKSIFTSELIKRTKTNPIAVQIVPPVTDNFISTLDSLPPEVKGRILEFLAFDQIIQLQSLSKTWKSLIQSYDFIRALSLRKQPKLTACYFFIQNGVWQWAGFDPNWSLDNSSSTNTGKWRRLPPLTFLPADCDPDADLSKQFLFCSKDGLVCMNFSKSPHEDRLIVFNPLTQHWTELPPLLHRRNPVLMHMLVDQATHSYQILVAGSSGSGDKHLSKITELYDSRTGQWQRVGDLPGPDFALNDYQAGVFQNGNIFCIGFLEVHDGRHQRILTKGILGYNVEDRRWFALCTARALLTSPILQLVENHGEIYLFSERVNLVFTEHWVDRVVWAPNATFELINVVKKRKTGGRSQEFALVPFNEWQMCIYNTDDHTGEVFDIQDQDKCEPLPTLPEKGFRGELGFFCLNPMSFILEVRFSSQV